MYRKMILTTITIVVTSLSFRAFASERTDTVTVQGVCESCKNRIEKAAKTAGASFANWNDTTKILEVKYDEVATSLHAIEKNIATVGYDTRDVKALTDAYNNLPSCCKYGKGNSGNLKECDEKSNK